MPPPPQREWIGAPEEALLGHPDEDLAVDLALGIPFADVRVDLGLGELADGLLDEAVLVGRTEIDHGWGF